MEIRRSESERLEDVCCSPNGLETAHNRGHNSRGRPFKPRGSQRGTFGVVGEIVFHGPEQLVAGSGIEGEVGIATVAGVVPSRKLNINFVLSVDADSSFRTIIEESQYGGFIHIVDVTFDLPLVNAEAEFADCEKFGGRVRTAAPHDPQVQVTVGIDGHVSRITCDHTSHAAVGQPPLPAHPLDSFKRTTRTGIGGIQA